MSFRVPGPLQDLSTDESRVATIRGQIVRLTSGEEC